MYHTGINGKGLRYKYNQCDLIPAILYNYERGLFAKCSGLLYYGIIPSEDAMVNGILVPIYSKEDYELLMLSEGANRTGMYEAIDVTKCILSRRYTGSVPIYALINNIREKPIGRITSWYIAHVWCGIQQYGDKFVAMAKYTGIIEPPESWIKLRWIYSVVNFIKKSIIYFKRRI
jgi:hypothetical protein